MGPGARTGAQGFIQGPGGTYKGPGVCTGAREYVQGPVGVRDARLGVEKRNAVEFEQSVVEWVRDHVADPLRHHDGRHDRQQVLDVVRDLHLRSAPAGNDQQHQRGR